MEGQGAASQKGTRRELSEQKSRSLLLSSLGTCQTTHGAIPSSAAAVNIDSKLVRGNTVDAGAADPGRPAGLVELQNGCACCSQSGELLAAVSELVTLSDLRQEEERFDHIVVEMSGVAEPRSVRNMFQEAAMYDMPLLER